MQAAMQKDKKFTDRNAPLFDCVLSRSPGAGEERARCAEAEPDDGADGDGRYEAAQVVQQGDDRQGELHGKGDDLKAFGAHDSVAILPREAVQAEERASHCQEHQGVRYAMRDR